MRALGLLLRGFAAHRRKEVAAQTRRFIETLQTPLRALYQRYPRDRLDDVDADGMRAVGKTVAWAHAAWVRIHPFADGNGRTSRVLANAILVRYGLPPVLALRPRPAGAYEEAANAAMEGDQLPMAFYVMSELLARAKR